MKVLVDALVTLFYAVVTGLLLIIAAIVASVMLISWFFSYRAKVRLTRLRVQMETEEWAVPEMNAELTRVRDQISEIQRRMNRYPVLEYLQIRYLDTLREQEVFIKQGILRKGGRVASPVSKSKRRGLPSPSPTLVLQPESEPSEPKLNSWSGRSTDRPAGFRKQEPSIVERRREYEAHKVADLEEIAQGEPMEEMKQAKQEKYLRAENYWDQKIAKLYGD